MYGCASFQNSHTQLVSGQRRNLQWRRGGPQQQNPSGNQTILRLSYLRGYGNRPLSQLGTTPGTRITPQILLRRQISFTRSGLTVPWDPRFISLLELAEACDVPVRWSCRTGVCHSCECALIGGAVAYQPAPLELPAEGNALICCSQPSSDIEIDL